MKATLEGTAEEMRQFFRTGTAEDLEQVCMFCGCTDEDPCPGGCSWAAPNVCSHCAEIVHEALKQDAPRKVMLQDMTTRAGKTAKNVGKRSRDMFDIETLLLPEFEHDRKLKSSYKTLFFTESDEGKVVLSYLGTKLYVRRDKVLELPYPVPHGYFGHPKSGTPSNRATAIRFYRKYLAEQPKSEKELKSEKPPEPKPTLLSGKNGAVVLAAFTEAERFDYSSLPKNNLGAVIYYENGDGRVAIKYYGHGDIVFITREQVEILKKMDKDALAEYIGSINTPKQFILKKYIEGLKDNEIGALGKVKTDTRVPRE